MAPSTFWRQDDSLDITWLHCSLVSWTHSHVTSNGTANVKGRQRTLWHMCGILHSGVPGHRCGRTNKQRTTHHLTRKMHVSLTISVFVLIAPTAHRISVEMDRKLHSAMALRVPWEQCRGGQCLSTSLCLRICMRTTAARAR
jgi:hypothetical protein